MKKPSERIAEVTNRYLEHLLLVQKEATDAEALKQLGRPLSEEEFVEHMQSPEGRQAFTTFQQTAMFGAIVHYLDEQHAGKELPMSPLVPPGSP